MTDAVSRAIEHTIAALVAARQAQVDALAIGDDDTAELFSDLETMLNSAARHARWIQSVLGMPKKKENGE